MKFKSVEEITSAILPIAESMSIEIVEVEAKVTKSPYLTVYIDTENGVDLDTCEKFHNAIDPILDDVDVSNGSGYTLNVSSPGLDRPLKTDKDFQKRIGKDVEVKLFAPLKGVKYFECKLVDYDGNNVVLNDGKEEFKLPLNRIAKINEAIKFD
jgi:ribosome maturation factor RimP